MYLLENVVRANVINVTKCTIDLLAWTLADILKNQIKYCRNVIVNNKHFTSSHSVAAVWSWPVSLYSNLS